MDYLRQRADSGFDEAGRVIGADALKEVRTSMGPSRVY
jgi:hypothetical protein